MRFYTRVHEAYCGIDLYARTMYVCIANRDDEILLHRTMPTSPEIFLKAIAPYRPDLVVVVECMFTWDLAGRRVRPRRADVCAGARPIHEGHPRGQSQE